ncbi:Chloroperoxidase [Aspergillus crustosus]
MKLTYFINAALCGIAAASPCGFESDSHQWHRPLPDQVRSPCPGLNVMANHGYLPRSGKNIDLATLRSALSAAYNYHPNTFDDAFAQAIAFDLSTTGNSSTFNLDDLKLHDAVEFDGSLSRNDFYSGDNLNYDPAIWKIVAEHLRLNKNGPRKEDKYVTVEAAAKARAARVQDAINRNPTFNASANQIQGSPGTTALYLTTLWDDKAGAAPKSWVKAFFEDERIPWREGYKKPEKQRNGTDIGILFERVSAVEV